LSLATSEGEARYWAVGWPWAPALPQQGKNMSGDVVELHVWSDYVCPFCYLEMPVIERLQAEYGSALKVEWHAFELRPEPTPALDPKSEYLRGVWSQSIEPMAEQRAMTLRRPSVQPRSRRAHEALEFARQAGRADAMNRALFRAHFEDGRDLGNMDILLEIGEAVGLDRTALSDALKEGRHTEKVVADQKLAQEIGITGVPALLLARGGTGFLVSGAQPYETVSQVVEQIRQVEQPKG
jgi:predicted DsbA family dithiol-disulfide isomerase